MGATSHGGRAPASGEPHGDLVPAWRQVTAGEHRWPVSLAIAVTVVMQLALPTGLILHPRWLLPALQALILGVLLALNPTRISGRSPSLRTLSLLLIAIVSISNAISAVALIVTLVAAERMSGARLLTLGADIWLTNVMVFALWYWELDRGGPGARAEALHLYPDFLFPQMESPGLAPRHWEPEFADYFYLAFTNATAFSPTDVLPLSRWAKFAMLLQAAVSFALIILVIARAVNILG